MSDEGARRRWSDWDVEGDTVIGRVGGKCLLTIVFVTSELFLARLLDRKTKDCVVAALDVLERIFKRHQERLVWQGENHPWWFFNTFLTDNGTEMGDFRSMERTVFKGRYEGMERMLVFYCDPYCSWQKPRIEVAHTLLRRVLPKGTSFDHLTQADIDLVCSHINSYSRQNLNGATPFEVAPPGFYGDGIYKALGLTRIDPDDINLTPGLLTR
jgi:IS30 family transposase